MVEYSEVDPGSIEFNLRKFNWLFRVTKDAVSQLVGFAQCTANKVRRRRNNYILEKRKKLHLHGISFICTLKVRKTNRSINLLRRIKIKEENVA